RPRCPAPPTVVQRIWRRTRSWTLALFGLRAMFYGRGRSREPKPELPARPGDRSPHVNRGVLPAHSYVAGRAGQLAELAYGIPAKSGATRRRPLAWFLDDGRRDDHQPLSAQCDGFDFDTNAVRHGRRRLLARRSYCQASPLRYALDRHHGLRHDLCPAGGAFPDAADHDL